MKKTRIGNNNNYKQQEDKIDIQEKSSSDTEVNKSKKSWVLSVASRAGSIGRTGIPSLAKKDSNNSLPRVFSQPSICRGATNNLPELTPEQKKRVLTQKKEDYEIAYDKLSEKIAVLEDEKEKLIKENRKLKNQKKSTEKVDEKLSERIKSIEEARKREKKENEEKIKKLVKKNTELLKEISDLKESLSLYHENDVKYQEAEKEIKRLRRNSANLVASSSLSMAERNSFGVQLEKLSSDYKLMLEENEALKKKIAELEGHVSEVENKIEEEKEETLLDPRGDNDITSYFRERISGLEKENKKLIGSLAKKARKITKLESQISQSKVTKGSNLTSSSLVLSPSNSINSTTTIDSAFMGMIDENLESLRRENDSLNKEVAELKKTREKTVDNLERDRLTNLIKEKDLQVSANFQKISEITLKVVEGGIKRNQKFRKLGSSEYTEEDENFGLVTADDLDNDETYQNLRKNNQNLQNELIERETEIAQQKVQLTDLRNQLLEKGNSSLENAFAEINLVAQKDEEFETMMAEIDALKGEKELLENNLVVCENYLENLVICLQEKFNIDLKKGDKVEDKLTGYNNLDEILTELAALKETKQQVEIGSITQADKLNVVQNESNYKERQVTPNIASDQGWLTDDNIEYILNNHENIQQTLDHNWKVRSDIANVHNCFFKAKNNLEWDLAEFLEDLGSKQHRYTIFPLRVSGNHWGMFILENQKADNEKMEKWVYYTSSGSKVKEEIEQIKPLINQLVGEKVANNIQIIESVKQNNGYDCGVYLIKYIQELLETGNLVLNQKITEQDCQTFRQEWKDKIGTDKWCKWDKMSEEDIKGDILTGDIDNKPNKVVRKVKSSPLFRKTFCSKSSPHPVFLETMRKGDSTIYLKNDQDLQFAIALEIQVENDREKLENNGYWDGQIKKLVDSREQQEHLQTIRHYRLVELGIDTEIDPNRLAEGNYWDEQINNKLLTNFQRFDSQCFRQQKLIQLDIEKETNLQFLEKGGYWDKQIKKAPTTNKYFRQKIDLQIIRRLRLNELEQQRDLIYNQIGNSIQEESNIAILSGEAKWHERFHDNNFTDQQKKNLHLLRNYRRTKLGIKEETNFVSLEDNGYWDKLIQETSARQSMSERQATGLQIFRQLKLKEFKEKTFIQIANNIQEELDLTRLEDRGYWDNFNANSLTERQRVDLQAFRHRQIIQIGIQTELDHINLADKGHWDNEIQDKDNLLTDQQKVYLQTLRKTALTKVGEITAKILKNEKRKAVCPQIDLSFPTPRPSISTDSSGADSGYASSKNDSRELQELSGKLEELKELLQEKDEEIAELEEELEKGRSEVKSYTERYNNLRKKTNEKITLLEREIAELKRNGPGGTVSQEIVQQKEKLHNESVANQNNLSTLPDDFNSQPHEELTTKIETFIISNNK